MPFPGPSSSSLTRRLLGPLLLVGLLCVGAGTWLTQRHLEEILREQMQARALALATAVVTAGEVSTTPVDFQRFVSAIGWERQVVLATVIAGSPPRVIASTNAGSIGQRWHELRDPAGEAVREALATPESARFLEDGEHRTSCDRCCSRPARGGRPPSPPQCWSASTPGRCPRCITRRCAA